MFTIILLIAVIAIGFLVGLIYSGYFQGGVCHSKVRLDGKTAVITGCNTGIGKETVLDLVKRGARVVMACRNMELAKKAAEDVKKESGSENVVVYQLDLASLASVRACAAEINEKEDRVDILINNAGVMMCPILRTEDGFEMQVGTNHLGHFLFTNLLLAKMKKSAPARIVTVSSLGHKRGGIDLADLNYEKRSYGRFEAYSQSKLANILFSKELAKRVAQDKITTYALHPGAVQTELSRHLAAPGSILDKIVFGLLHFFVKNPKQGAQTSIYCAVEESLANETGKYYSDCAEAQPTSSAKDPNLALALWELSEKLTGISQ